MTVFHLVKQLFIHESEWAPKICPTFEGEEKKKISEKNSYPKEEIGWVGVALLSLLYGKFKYIFNH